MMVLVIQGWEIGFQKVAFTNLLRSEFGYSLSGAKSATDSVLEAKQLELEVPDAEISRVLSKCRELGVRAVAEPKNPVPS